MVMSTNNDIQAASSAPWLSTELAATIESDAALRELLAPVHRWLNTLSVRNHSPHTLTAYFAGLNQLALFLRGKRLTWTRCDTRQLAQHISQRLDEDKLALASVQQELSAIRHFYGWMIEEELARINPTTGYQLKRSPRPLPSIADVDLLTQLLDQPHTQPLTYSLQSTSYRSTHSLCLSLSLPPSLSHLPILCHAHT